MSCLLLSLGQVLDARASTAGTVDVFLCTNGSAASLPASKKVSESVLVR